MIVNATFVKDKDNGKTLEELGVGASSVVTVSRKLKATNDSSSSSSYYYNSKNVEEGSSCLLTPEMRLTEKAQRAFTEIFARFSKDGKMSLDDCVNFTKAATGDFNATQQDMRVKNLFNRFATETENYVVLDQFLKFYEAAAKERERTVWMNLSELGYDRDMLMCGGEPLLGTGTAAGAALIPAAKLPRNLLANNPDYFDLLLKIFRTVPS